VSGFACSEKAAYIISLGKEEAVRQVLRQLDDMFGNKIPTELLRDSRLEVSVEEGQSNGATPATDAFMDSHIQNWQANPFVLGGYSSPSLGESAASRDALAAHVDGKVFFCGEHTNRSYMTLNSAMKTGEIAAEEVIKATQTNK